MKRKVPWSKDKTQRFWRLIFFTILTLLVIYYAANNKTVIYVFNKLVDYIASIGKPPEAENSKNETLVKINYEKENITDSGGGGVSSEGGGGGSDMAQVFTPAQTFSYEEHWKKIYSLQISRTNCSEADRDIIECEDIQHPVCGWFDPQAINCTQDLCVRLFNNECEACKNPNIFMWNEGDCPLHG